MRVLQLSLGEVAGRLCSALFGREQRRRSLSLRLHVLQVQRDFASHLLQAR
jgi:hypothetical protein